MDIVLLPDASHGNHNDLHGAIRSCRGMWLTILLCHMAFNSLAGPWNGTALWGQLQEGVSHFLSDASPTGPLLQFFLPSVAEERGEMELLADPGYAAHVLETLREEGGFLKKGPRVRLCIWSS